MSVYANTVIVYKSIYECIFMSRISWLFVPEVCQQQALLHGYGVAKGRSLVAFCEVRVASRGQGRGRLQQRF